MTIRVHCNGPDCEETRNPDFHDKRMCTEPWLHVEEVDGPARHDFHTRACLAAWAAAS